MFAPRRLLELGLLLGVIGALTVVVGIVTFLRKPDSGSAYRQRWWTLAGVLVIAVGFLVQLAGELSR